MCCTSDIAMFYFITQLWIANVATSGKYEMASKRRRQMSVSTKCFDRITRVAVGTLGLCE